MRVRQYKLERRMRAFTVPCRANGPKAAHQRMAFFHKLAATELHPDAETTFQGVRQRVPAVSRDALCRAPAMMDDHGLIRKAEALGGSIRFEADIHRRSHFICSLCGMITMFHSQALAGITIMHSVKSRGVIESAQAQVRGVRSARTGQSDRAAGLVDEYLAI